MLDLRDKGLVMGIVNLTPDSFSDGGKFFSPEAALAHALALVEEGAAILDLGGESTRPGAARVSLEEELARVCPVLKKLRPRTEALISIDTTKAEVARQALELGADIINDISALQEDPAMMELVAGSDCGVVLMHRQGTPQTMQLNPHYEDVVGEVREFLGRRLVEVEAAGIDPSRVVLDPGIGFGKTRRHNLSLLRELEELTSLPRPLLLGVSRKSFLADFVERDGPDDPGVAGGGAALDRHWPGVALTSLGRERGVRIFRVHEVRDHLHALRMTEAILYSTD
jgi:dihydropteroate synthase